jgi:hypothetical protein
VGANGYKGINLSKTYLENNELKLSNVVRVDPVFRSLAHKVLLTSSGRGISLGGVSFGTDEII